jgi:hypothetical protein
MLETLMVIINLNTGYRELASSFRSSSIAYSSAWALWVIFEAVYDWFVSTITDMSRTQSISGTGTPRMGEAGAIGSP